MGGRVVSGIAIVLRGRLATILLPLIVPYLCSKIINNIVP